MKKYILHKKSWLALLVLLTTVTVACESVFALLMQDIIDKIYDTEVQKLLYQLPLYLGYIGIMIFFSYLNTKIIIRYVEKIMYQLRNDLFSSVLSNNIDEFGKKKLGDYISLFNNDLDMIENDCILNVFYIYGNAVGIILQVIIGAYINLQLTLIVIFVCVLILLFPAVFTRYIEGKRGNLLEAYELMNSYLNNYLSGFEYIKISVLENLIVKKFEKRLHYLEEKKFKFSSANNMVQSLLKILSLSVIILILVLGAIFVDKAYLSIGGLVAILQIYSSVFQMISELAYKINNYFTAKPAIEKIADYLNHRIEIPQNTEIISVQNITFKNVSFSYGNQIIMKDCNVEFLKGKKYAIIGESGSGKSTMVNMILKKVIPDSGRILINDHDYKEMQGLYNHIGYVAQNIFLFNDTLQFNIDLGKPSQNINSLLYEFDLNQFVDTDLENIIIKEAATNLSGGEKQRIAILRELLKAKEVLITDEATSNMPTDQSVKIYEYLLKQKEQMLICIIHNYTEELLQNFDYVIEVNNGEFKIKNVVTN